PLGMADVATVLWTRFLRYDPTDPAWPDRDRFVLSGGHGSMLLYSMLYLTGTSLTIEDLKSFRQWGSKCAGHPEHGEAPGIETTTGPLGQGFANAVGMAIAEGWLRGRFGEGLVNHWTYVTCGDGDLMEGVCAEAASIAGHLKLGRLVVLWDDNKITIDGATDLSISEDTLGRFAAMGWHVQSVDGHDREAVAKAIAAARDETEKPSIIACRTKIGFGSPNKEGKSAAHGAPLGVDEVKLTKQRLGLDPDVTFAVPEDVVAGIRAKDADRKVLREAWEARVADSPKGEELRKFLSGELDLAAVAWPQHTPGPGIASRKASEAAIQAIAAAFPNVVGGSADLAESNFTHIKGGGEITPSRRDARNVAYGIREHAMGAIANGISLHGGLRTFCGTFLIFHDYMRPAVGLAALMHQPVVYVYTHDSVWVGEDGPTHQPIETLQAIRLIPNVRVLRPADANETNEAWKLALARTDGPTALALTRQNLPTLDRSKFPAADSIAKGGYVLRDAPDAKVVLIGTGSEVHVALEAADRLAEEGIPARVVNMACCEIFDAQDAAYKASVLPRNLPRVSVEAGTTKGWERYVGLDGASVGIDRFGASAPGKVVAEKLGINVPNVVAAAKRVLG
ncbi:MAG: transketolase, partial [Myxococcota bacterium]